MGTIATHPENMYKLWIDVMNPIEPYKLNE